MNNIAQVAWAACLSGKVAEKSIPLNPVDA
jgi:hypothetical protein